MQESQNFYLGLDLSTQQLKAVVVEIQSEVCHDQKSSAGSHSVRPLIVHEENVIFDRLDFDTKSGVRRKDSDTVVAPVEMWLAALDVLFHRLATKLDLSRVIGIGGSAQQHGTVYWQDVGKLRRMDPQKSLRENLNGAFSLEESPVWMDSSTSGQCRAMEHALGGPQAMAEISGSRAYERFSGPQIAKVAESKPQVFSSTQRISLVSSFLHSILIGNIAPIDLSDASGMNLMDIRTNTWSEPCLEACVASVPGADRPSARTELLQKLGGERGLVESGADLGEVGEYFQEKYNFSANCRIAAFTGDNPGSFACLCGSPDDLVLSMGSSDTLLFWAEKRKSRLLQGHLMVNPVDPSKLMGMLCFKNGGLMRDVFVNELAAGCWDRFDQLLASTAPGNGGKVGVFLDLPEILPERQGRYRFDLNGNEATVVDGPFSPAEEVRALIEGQFMCKRLYLDRLRAEFATRAPSRLLVTGGAARNRVICQILADVFGVQVLTPCNPSVSTAALGGVVLAFRCTRAAAYERNRDLFQKDSKVVASPQNQAVYDGLLPKFRACLERFGLF